MHAKVNFLWNGSPLCYSKKAEPKGMQIWSNSQVGPSVTEVIVSLEPTSFWFKFKGLMDVWCKSNKVTRCLWLAFSNYSFSSKSRRVLFQGPSSLRGWRDWGVSSIARENKNILICLNKKCYKYNKWHMGFMQRTMSSYLWKACAKRP